MSHTKEKDDFVTPTKKIRFRGDLPLQNRVEEVLFEDDTKRRNSLPTCGTKPKETTGKPSLFDFFKVEMTRGYMLEHDEERFASRREKIYSFMRIPRDVERFIWFAAMQCADSFLYIHTFLPVRVLCSLWAMTTRPIARCFGLKRRTQLVLTPSEICDILKCFIWLCVISVLLCIDMNRAYHIIKSQSIIKLYIFYNMLEVGDRLLSAFGQDTIDALFWTATESKISTKRQKGLGLACHMVFALFYCLLHSFLIMFQATTLNVAINSSNKALLTIMISNNFVELKGSVFKKFDKNNLFQLTCCDVRERFHLTILLLIVTIQTMKEFDWQMGQMFTMIPDCISVVITEVLIDWVKHAFITRFNEIPESVYKEYTISLAYDMTQTRQKHAFSDHSDLVARRMGFIPFPLSVVLIKAIHAAVTFDNLASLVLVVIIFIILMVLRVYLTILALGISCKVMKDHHQTGDKSNSQPSSVTNVTPVGPSIGINMNFPTKTSQPPSTVNSPRQAPAATPQTQYDKVNSNFLSTPKYPQEIYLQTLGASDVQLDPAKTLELGATALFSNSDVDLDDVCLNEDFLDSKSDASDAEEKLARSEPDLFHEQHLQSGNTLQTSTPKLKELQPLRQAGKRTHKRSESEPSIQNITGLTAEAPM